jgi:hypothetical protein
MAEDPKSQTTPAVESLPEPDLDSLLSNIPLFKDVFAGPEGESGDAKQSPEEKEEPSSEAVVEAPAEAPEEVTPPEEQPPSEEQPPPEEPKAEIPESVQKRIDKLTAQRKTAEEKAATLEAELASLKGKFNAPPPVMPTPSSPLANVEDENELVDRLDKAQRVKAWAFENLDGGQIDLGEGKTKWIEGTEVKQILSRAEMLISKHIPERKVYLTAKRDFDSQALKAYPWLFKAGSKENAELNSWLTVFPECRKYPDITLIVGDAIIGRSMRLAKGVKGKPTNGQTPPLATPQPASAPRVPKSRTLSSEELSSIATDPSGKALDRFVDQLIAGGQEARAAAKRS